MNVVLIVQFILVLLSIGEAFLWAFLSEAMAASSGRDILARLAALQGRESVCHIRQTGTVPPQVSTMDVAAAIIGKSHDAAAQDFRRMSKQHPDVSA